MRDLVLWIPENHKEWIFIKIKNNNFINKKFFLLFYFIFFIKRKPIAFVLFFSHLQGFLLSSSPTNPPHTLCIVEPDFSGHFTGRRGHHGVVQLPSRPYLPRNGIKRRRDRAKQPTILTTRLRFCRRSVVSPPFQSLPCSVRLRNTLS